MLLTALTIAFTGSSSALRISAAAIDQAIKDAKRPLSDDSVGVLITGSVITVGESRTIINGKYKK